MPQEPVEQLDALVIGAGFSGLYALHHLRGMDLSVAVCDGAGGIGGTWWYNGYPGARVDGPGSPFYCYTFADELMQEWDWADTQPSQAEVLAYLEHVADRFDLTRHIRLNTWIRNPRYDEAAQRWTVDTSTGGRISAQFLICAVGALSTANRPDIPGIDEFAGECHHTGNWPHEPVRFAGKRVGVIGTGSSGIQAIPEIAKEAVHLTVFQRTPQFSFPARNQPLTAEELASVRDNWDALKANMRNFNGGFPWPRNLRTAAEDTPAERQALFERLWQEGTLKFIVDNYSDLLTNKETNGMVADFVRGKIREIVRDPATADKLMPDHYVATKRPVLDNGYFEAYNRENVTLVDLREDPIERITPSGVCTATGVHPLDMLVLATGFDAISGTFLRLNPKGRAGMSLKERWRERYHNYLGLMISGFPNLFMVHGPGTPGVLYNMPLGAEREIEWVGNCIAHLRGESLGAVEATPAAETAWAEEVAGIANRTLYPLTDSWYTGANIPGKPRQFPVHLGGPHYFERLAQVAASDYEGIEFEAARNAPRSATSLGTSIA
ncbi:MAG: NAD(P)/FAD-dependent oxidoreductase [Gammaproteobacteria bacterium]|nr:NAD(P)/FAD-dependent oxidoreductase [Gammaproteobacteria bacterium]MYK82757.1 NAD(P)/FAD-dependent oxidoreductase [Gammaproteobacteria bacterium]